MMEMAAEQLAAAHHMWMQGATVRTIARTLHIRDQRFSEVAAVRRDLFPRRTRVLIKGSIYLIPINPSAIPFREKVDRMRWVTEQGAHVTLPKISFIECPRAAA